jgi:hypothetical protein
MAGRPPTYHVDEERPVSVSLRMPKALYEQAQQRVQQRRMTLTEALLEGLQLWLETPTDPRALFVSDNSNTTIAGNGDYYCAGRVGQASEHGAPASYA